MKSSMCALASLAILFVVICARLAGPLGVRRVRPGYRVFAALAAAASCALFSPVAGAAGPALTLPSFQELITPPAPASAPDAAAASAVGDAELTRSLDNVISTLDSDKQRAALVAQLKKLRD